LVANIWTYRRTSRFFSSLLIDRTPGLAPEGKLMLGLTLWMAIWWITEAVPIAGTALLPLMVLPLAGVLNLKQVSNNYMDPTVLLYMGGIFAGYFY
jgi:solute carrier family 13 (sodium-dependent dicarboxylate transporter), member 2/3/5